MTSSKWLLRLLILIKIFILFVRSMPTNGNRKYQARNLLADSHESQNQNQSLKPFEEWNSLQDMQEFILHNSAEIAQQSIIDIDGQNLHFYVPQQHPPTKMVKALMHHWASNPPDDMSDQGAANYPQNQDWKHPYWFFHGRLGNPYLTMKHDPEDGMSYWTDDGLGDHNNLWTSTWNQNENALWPEKMPSENETTSILWYPYRYALDPTGNQMVGFIVVFERSKEEVIQTWDHDTAEKTVDPTRDKVIFRFGEGKHKHANVTTAVVFTPESQKDCEIGQLTIRRVYFMHWGHVSKETQLIGLNPK